MSLRHSRDLIEPHLKRLAELPSHGNRKLGIDQLFLGLLLSFFNPMARSLRMIQDCGDFSGKLDLPRLARSTTADALEVMDPAHLQPILQDLRERIPKLACTDADLQSITRQIIAADGTYLNTLCDVAWALRHTKSNGKKQGQVRANVQMDTASWTPQVISVSGDDHQSEPAAFTPDLLCGVLYVIDANFLDFSFLDELLARGSDFVLRVKSNAPATRALQELPLSAADVQAGVTARQRVILTGKNAPRAKTREHEFTLVTLSTTDRQGKAQTIRLLSSLTQPDITAATIAAAYRQRWQIELFFKWLKTFARMDHLLSTSRNGITFQLYVATIAVLVMTLQSGHRVSIYSLQALSRVANGQMSLEEAMQVIARRERERELDRARQALRRARKKLA